MVAVSDSGDQFSRALRAGRERQALMDAAVASFRALAVHERMQFLICIEADIANALAASSVTVATPIVVEKPAVIRDDIDARPKLDSIDERSAIVPIVKNRVGRWSKYDAAQIQRVLELYAAGKSGCKIAVETGIPQNSVYLMLKQHRGPLREQAHAPAAAPVVAPPRAPVISPTLYVHTRKKVDRPVAREHVTKPSGKRSKAATADSEDSPALYFRDVSRAGKILTPTEEIALATKLEATELTMWNLVLKSPASARARAIAAEMIADARARGGGDHLDLDGDPSMVAKDARPPVKVSSLDAAAMRTADPDRRCIDTVIHEYKTVIGDDVRRLYADATRIRDLFVTKNLRLVISVARRYIRGAGTMPIADLIQEGNLGLIHAVPRFDHHRGLRFSTFAVWWIRHALSRGLSDKSRTVRLPVHLAESMSILRRRGAELTKELGREPTHAELAVAAKMPEKKIDQLTGSSHWLVGYGKSLDTPIGDPDGRSLMDELVDPQSEELSLADSLANAEQVERLQRALARLSPADAELMRLRFGLGRENERTFQEIGDMRGLSRERIRQLEVSALKKLRTFLTRNDWHRAASATTPHRDRSPDSQGAGQPSL